MGVNSGNITLGWAVPVDRVAAGVGDHATQIGDNGTWADDIVPSWLLGNKRVYPAEDDFAHWSTTTNGTMRGRQPVQ
ncbi:MAG TPA: hypothetical protein VKQ34_03500 [Candidatus Saccharimonadales bacterium]|nr:hypothetical protein [Candidatus Saccharimonadales bacterium]